MVSFRCFCVGSRVSVLYNSQGSWSVRTSEKSERKKKRAGSVIGKERKTEEREKKRACKHFFTEMPQSAHLLKNRLCQNVKTSKGALV